MQEKELVQSDGLGLAALVCAPDRNDMAALEERLIQVSAELEKAEKEILTHKRTGEQVSALYLEACEARDQAQQDRDLARQETAAIRAAAEQLRGNARDLGVQLKRKDAQLAAAEAAVRRIREEMHSMINRSIKWPLVSGAGFVALAIAVGVATEMQLVQCCLGEPLAYLLLCFAGVCCGMIWERTRGGERRGKAGKR
jgi:hypothetical protein